MMNSIEPILKENKDRFVLFPIKHDEIWKLYKEIENRFWTAQISLKEDGEDFKNNLSDDEKCFYVGAISAIVLKHKIFGEKSITGFLNDIQYPEARCFHGFELMMGNIYYEIMSEICALLSYKEEEEISKLMNMLSVKAMIDWLEINFTKNTSFAGRLIAYACFKRIIFSGLMAGIISFRLTKRMEDICMLMTFIFEDEGLYTDFALTVYGQLENKENPAVVNRMIKEAAELENNFMEEYNGAFANKLIPSEKTSSFVDYISSSITESLLNNSVNTKKSNPFDYITWKRSFIKIEKKREKKQEVVVNTYSFDTDF